MLISDSAAINYLPHKVFDSLKWNIIKRCNQIIHNCETCCQITFIKIVQYVPTQWAKFTSLQNDRVEKAQIESKSFLLLWLAPIYHIQNFLHVWFYSSGRLACYLNTVLENGDREIIARHTRQIEPEILV